MIIKKINAEKTFQIRHPILRKGLPLDSCKFENDDDENSIHLCAIENNELIAVISALPNICPFFPEKKAFQIRGLAVIEKFRRRGIASALIKETEITLRNKFSIELIWLNSRTIASKLYTCASSVKSISLNVFSFSKSAKATTSEYRFTS